MKFKPLEFVTNKIAGTSSSGAHGLCDSEDDDSSSASNHVKFDVPSSPDAESDNDDSQYFSLRKEDRRRGGKPKQSVGAPKSGSTSPTKTTIAAKTPSPRRNSGAKKISPPTESADTSSKISNKDVSPVEKNKEKDKSRQTNKSKKNNQTSPPKNGDNMPTSTATATNTTVTPTPQKKSKKRMTVYEQLSEDAQAAADKWKEDAEENLRYKRQVHKEKLREIREKEEEMKKLGDQLKKLKESASSLEGMIQKDIEKKKLAVKLGNILRRTSERTIKKSLKDKEDSRANMKAKDAVLKQALRDAKKKRLARDDDDSEEEGTSKKKRKTGGNKSKSQKQAGSKRRKDQEDESSDEDSRNSNDSDDSDADDSDWEGAPRNRKKKSDVEVDAETSENTPRRQTRVRKTPVAVTVPAPPPEAIAQLTSMGFEEQRVKEALQVSDNNVERAANILLTGS